MALKKEEILSHVDHTLLKQTATWQQVQKLCQEGIKQKNGICLHCTLLCKASGGICKRTDCHLYRDRVSKWLSDN